MKRIKILNRTMFIILILSSTFLISSCRSSTADADSTEDIDMQKEWQKMNAAKKESIESFKDAKFGMFIHWGIYSIPAGVWEGKRMEEMGRPWVAEWVQYVAKIPRDEYALLAEEFNPVKYNADSIAKLAKDAGMKYVVITSKHHDGFAMYDSKVSEFDIMDASPFKRDIVGELYNACKKYGLDFGLYYSHNIDWADGGDCQYSVIKEMNDKKGEETRIFGPNLWDPSPNSFDEYVANKAVPQVKEIMTKYPDLSCLWYDMSRYMTPEQSFMFYKLATDLQPQILINERVGNGFGDYEIPGDNKIPSDTDRIVKPWETVGTLNNSWGYKSYDNDWKSVDELLFWLVEIVSKGGNYMLNIGPKASGEVPEESIQNLREVGRWLSINGNAIYGAERWKVTHEGPTKIKMDGTASRQEKGFKIDFTPEDFWFTKKDNKLYVISFDYPEGKAVINNLTSEKAGEIKSVKLLGADSDPEWTQTTAGLEVDLKGQKPNPGGYCLEVSVGDR